MKTFTKVAAFGIAVGLVAGGAQAQERGQETQQYTQQRATNLPPEAQREVAIKVQKVDPKSHKVTFEAQVSPEAQVYSSGRPVALDQLKAGDEVRVSFDPSTGHVIRVDRIMQGQK